VTLCVSDALQAETSIRRENAVAKDLVAAGRRDRALLALKKRQLHEQQLLQLDAWLLNVEAAVCRAHHGGQKEVRILCSL
jgi:Snf7